MAKSKPMHVCWTSHFKTKLINTDLSVKRYLIPSKSFMILCNVISMLKFLVSQGDVS